MSKGELDGITVEISILSEPELVEGSRAKRLEAVKVGRDGLMVEYGLYSGLLLPVVAVEQHWSAQELLEQTCLKAGLGMNHWSQPGVDAIPFPEPGIQGRDSRWAEVVRGSQWNKRNTLKAEA